MPAVPEIVSAGAVVARKVPGGDRQDRLEILLVHRPKYDDWSFPKGKLDALEHPAAAAVREVAEETGLDVRLGPPLSSQTYAVRGDYGSTRAKRVHYWTATPVHGDDVSGYAPNDEVDQVAWVELDKAREQLTYAFDLHTLEESLRHRKRTYPLVVLRHAKARARSSWEGDDRERPLTRLGELQSEQLVPILGAYGVTRLVSSSSRRCWSTIAPYADVADLEIEESRDLSEEDATPAKVAATLSRLLGEKEPALVCTHRPVLPLVFEHLGIQAPGLQPGSLAVAHHRRGKVVTVEVHTAPSGH